MKISTLLNYDRNFGEVVDEVVAYEEAGLDAVWVPEAYSFDAATAMGFLAARTERIEIGSGILPVYTRTPSLLAMTAAGLDAISGGRAVLGLGASGPQVIEGWHGIPYDAPVGRTREVIEICRQVWRRERVTYQGDHYELPLPEGQGTGLGRALKLIPHPVRERIPIMVASLGEKNVELTAEMAEMWLPVFFWPERSRDVWGAALDRGRARRDASLGPLQTVAGGALAIGEGLEPLRDSGRPMAALYIGGMGAKGRNFYNNVVTKYGFDREAAEIQELYLSGQKPEAEAAVPAELLEATSLIGPPDYVAERVAAFAAAGVTYLQVTPIAQTLRERAAQIRRLREIIDRG